jgi:hypothetical protein
LIRRLREKQDGLYIFFPQKNPYNERCTVDATGGTRNRDKGIMNTVNIQARKKIDSQNLFADFTTISFKTF